MSDSPINVNPATQAATQPSLWRSGLHTLGTNTILIPLGILSSIFIARVLGPVGKGSYDLVLATTALLGMALGLSLPSGVTYIVARGKTAPGSLALQMAPIGLLQGALAAALLYVLRHTRYSTAILPSGMVNQAIIAIAISLCCATPISYWRSILIGRQAIIQVNRIDLLSRVVNLALWLIGAGVWSAVGRQVSAMTFVWINVIVTVLANLIFLQALRPLLFSPGGGKEGVREVVAFALPCYMGNLVQFLNYRLDVFLVSFLVGTEGVGLYALAVSIAQLIWLISNAAATVLLPRVAAVEGSDLETTLRTAQVTRLVVWVSILSALLLALFANPLLPLVYGDAFRRSIAPLWWLLPGIVAFSVVNVLASYIAGSGKPQVNLLIALVGLFFTVTLDVWLIPRLGIVGAAIASTVSYSVSAALTIGFFMRKSGMRLWDVLLITREDARLASSYFHRIAARAFPGRGLG